LEDLLILYQLEVVELPATQPERNHPEAAPFCPAHH
jgi:hypothetical protein